MHCRLPSQVPFPILIFPFREIRRGWTASTDFIAEAIVLSFTGDLMQRHPWTQFQLSPPSCDTSICVYLVVRDLHAPMHLFMSPRTQQTDLHSSVSIT